MPSRSPPEFRDVEAAAGRIAGHAVETPLLEAPLLEAELGGRLLIKAETLQRTGSFKFRGAYNFLSNLPPERRKRGVIAHSSGNHAQGVAAAAALYGVPATILMPHDAPAIKVENTRRLGATVRRFDRWRDDREALSVAEAETLGATVVPPYDHPWTIAGQGTIGLELARQFDAIGLAPDAVLVPCGGGGLVSGIAIALAELLPGTEVWIVEPQGFDDAGRSLAVGRRVENAAGGSSLCDALLVPTPGEIPYEIMRRYLTGALVVDDAAVRRAMAMAFRHFKLAVEPGGAVALAAVLHGLFDVRGRTVVAVASGGNVSPGLFRDVLSGGAEADVADSDRSGIVDEGA